jgi:hypothetical protein
LSGLVAGDARGEESLMGEVDSATPAEVDIDELGPIDFVVVEFPPDRQSFTGEMAEELLALHESGVVRILDLVVIAKAEDGSIEGMEIDDDEEGLDPIRALETEIAEILAAEDVALMAEAMEPGSVAGVVVWENRWAAPFAAAARRAGGQLIADGRIPIQAILASLEAESDEDESEGE